MRTIIRSLILVSILVFFGMPLALGADEPTPPPSQPDIRMLAEEVDVLQLVADMNLTEKQITFITDKLTDLAKKQAELRKQDEAILQGIAETLQKMRDALAAGKEVPSSAKSTASAKEKELQSIRLQMWQNFRSAVTSCVQLLDEGQIRKIKRTPEAIARANQIIQQVRSASEENWPQVQAKFTSELLEVKKLDKQQAWQAEEDGLKKLTGEERDKAVKDFEKRKEDEIAQMRTETEQILSSIRTADQQILFAAVNKLASALRTNLDVQIQLQAMMGRILDSPGAPTALKSRLENMKN